jgi:hypothetical protein
VEDAGLLQHGALLDAEERRVVLCSSNQASEQSASRNGDGRRDPRRNAPDLGRCERGSGHIHIHARTGTRTHTHTTGGARARNGGTGRERQTRGADARARAHAPSSSRSSSFFTTSGCAMAAAAVGATRARGRAPEPAAAARGGFPGARAVGSLDLEWRRRGAYRNGEACGMDLNLAPGKDLLGERGGGVHHPASR